MTISDGYKYVDSISGDDLFYKFHNQTHSFKLISNQNACDINFVDRHQGRIWQISSYHSSTDELLLKLVKHLKNTIGIYLQSDVIAYMDPLWAELMPINGIGPMVFNISNGLIYNVHQFATNVDNGDKYCWILSPEDRYRSQNIFDGHARPVDLYDPWFRGGINDPSTVFDWDQHRYEYFSDKDIS